MSLTLKLASLLIRTLAKPVGNRIKARAREHETFRKTFVGFAQGLHRFDMRMRLGILHDAAAQERMYARDAAEAAKKKKEAETPTVRTEAEQKSHEEDGAKDAEDKGKQKPPPTKIRPLPEAKAIDLGANFASESFIFMVAAGLLIFERWWSRRKETAKDEHVVERLIALEEQTETISYLEAEVQRLRTELTARDNEQLEKSAKSEKTKGAKQTVKKSDERKRSEKIER